MAGGGGGTTWVKILGLGLALLTLAHGLVVAQVELGFGHPALLAVGGLMVVFGSCEAMILCVEGIAQRMRWNPFVAGTMAGLAANVPELIMLGFVLAAKPRLGFIVVAMTLHVGAMAFGLYIDQGSTGVTAAGNAIVGTPSAGILYQDSTGTIEGNLLFDAPDAEWAINAPAVTPGDNLIATTGNPAGAEIFYNDTAVPVVIPLAAGYADLDGNPVSELSLDPFDAAVLVATMR